MLKFKLFFIYSVVDNYSVRIVLYTKGIWPSLTEDMDPTRWSHKQGNFVNLKLASMLVFSCYAFPSNPIMDVNEH